MALHTRAGPRDAGPAVSVDLRRVLRGTPLLTQLPPRNPRTAVSLRGVRAGLSGDRGVTDLSLAGAHRRLLLSRPPPRRTVRTLLEKQNWGVRHRGLLSESHPSLEVMEGPLQGRGPAWRVGERVLF